MQKILIAILLFFSFLIYKADPAFAQTSQGTTKPISRCLASAHCLTPGVCTVTDGHRSRLTTDPKEPPLEVNHATYIVECFSYVPVNGKTAASVCSTGSSQLDNELFKVDNFSKLKNDLGLAETALFRVDNNVATPINPITTVRTDAKSYLPTLELHDYTPQGHTRQFLAFQLIEVGPAIRTKIGGEQQAVLDFLADPQVCAPVSWDPDGRAFDGATLDPIPGVTVSLVKKYADGYQNALRSEKIVNPQITSNDGYFSFYVTDGDYKLTATALGYTFPATDITKVNPNYKKIYVNPDAYLLPPAKKDPLAPLTKIYPSETTEVITVKGKPQHVDIPLLSNKSGGVEYKKVSVKSVVEQRMLSSGVSVQGEVSHPFAKVTVYVSDINSTSNLSTPLSKVYQADRYGRFSITLDQKSLPAGKMYDHLGFTAVNLADRTLQGFNLKNSLLKILAKLQFKVEAQTPDETTIKLNQIPLYLEGYAYDAFGKTLANATVGIYLNYSENPSSEVKTDEKGYFKITSEYLPNTPYNIRYTTSTGLVVKITPEQFIKQNTKYLTDNNINLFGYKDVKGGTNPPKFSTFAQGAGEARSDNLGGNPKLSPAAGGGVQPLTASSKNKSLLFLIVLLFIVGILGLVAGLYLLKKNQQQSPLPPSRV